MKKNRELFYDNFFILNKSRIPTVELVPADVDRKSADAGLLTETRNSLFP